MVHIEYLIDYPNIIGQVARWNYETWGYLFEESSYEGFLAGLSKVIGRRQIPTTFVALEEDIPIGSVGLVARENVKSHLSPWVSSLFVQPEHRNRGLGRLLLDRVIEECHSLGVRTIFLQALHKQEPYYSKLGWEIKEHVIYRCENVVIMSKDTGVLPSSIGEY